MHVNFGRASGRANLSNATAQNSLRIRKSYDVNRTVLTNFPSTVFSLSEIDVQAKMRVSQSDDAYEREADK